MNRILRFLLLFAAILLIFIVAKPLFILANKSLYPDINALDTLAVIWHGLKMDCSMAAYCMIIPGILLIGSSFAGNNRVIDIIWKIYSLVLGILLSGVLCLDSVLYSFWEFKLDATPFFYFLSSPKAAMASVSWEFYVIGLIFIAIIAWIIFKLLNFIWKLNPLKGKREKLGIPCGIALIFLTLLLFIPIRGGVTVSTMNLSSAYFSDDTRLNHAAFNPMFSLFHSLSHQSDPATQFQFYDPEETKRNVAEFLRKNEATDTISPIRLKREKPDITIIILESFSSHLFPSLGGEAIATRLDSIANGGVMFTNVYASSFRTDRGLTAILSGYPGMPTASIMKYVEKTDKLPSLPKTLKQNGYELSYFYGGDINFTNMNAYLRSAGFQTVIKDGDFPVSQKLSKWGAHDDVLFEKVKGFSRQGGKPELRVIQTSSSHEPFEVPYHNPKMNDARKNAFAFTDSVVADFILKEQKEKGRWDNSVYVLIPDHWGAWPEHLEEGKEKFRIPLIMMGGALDSNESGRRIDRTASQTDLVATLLGMLGLESDEFPFSHNIFDNGYPEIAIFSNPSYIGMMTPNGETMIDINTMEVKDDEEYRFLKSYLQMLYTDFSER